MAADEVVPPPPAGFKLDVAQGSAVPPPPPGFKLDAPSATAQSNFIQQTVSNIPASAMNVAKNLYQAISHPINTAAGIVDIGAGALQAAFAPESFKGNRFLYSPEAKRSFDTAASFYKSRYGSVEGFKEAVKTDPVGVTMDVSAATGLVGAAADVAGLANASRALSAASSATNPLALAGRGAAAIAKPVYEHAAGMTTGAGSEAIRQALRGGDAFTQAMRGTLKERDVLDTARDALQTIKNERSLTYRKQLADISKSEQRLDIAPIKAAADEWLDRYGVGHAAPQPLYPGASQYVRERNPILNQTAPGAPLDFSRSTLRNNPPAMKEVQAVYDTVQEWGSRPNDLTPLGMDTLKRVIRESYSSENTSRAMVTDLSNRVKTTISKSVPKYGEMVRDYETASEAVTDLTKGLSLGERVSTDTALRKLMVTMRADPNFRRTLLNTLDRRAGSDVAGAVAGLLLKNPWSGKLGPVAHFYGTSAIAAYLHNPFFAALLPAASPRFMGEVSKAAGQIGEAAPGTVPLLSGAYQAERAESGK